MQTDWIETNQSLTKTFKFSDFLSAIHWMSSAANVIEKLGHHPEWTNIYNKVTVKLTTHDAGNAVTDKDRELAKLLDSIPLK